MSITCTKEFTIEDGSCEFSTGTTRTAFMDGSSTYSNSAYSEEDCYLLIDGFYKYDVATNARVLKDVPVSPVKQGVFNPITGYFYYSDTADNLVIFDPATEAITAVTPMGATVNSNGFKQMQYVPNRSLIYMFDELRNFGYIDTGIPGFVPLATFPARNFYAFEYSQVSNAFYISWTDGPFYGLAKFALASNTYSEIYSGVISTTALAWDSIRSLLLIFENADVLEFDTATDTVATTIAIPATSGYFRSIFVPSSNKVFMLPSGSATSPLVVYNVASHAIADSLADYRYLNIADIQSGNLVSWIDTGAPLYTRGHRIIAPT